MGNLVNFAPVGWWSDSYDVMEFGSNVPVRTIYAPGPCKICGDPNDHYGQPHTTANDRYGGIYQYNHSFTTTRQEAETYAERYLQRLKGEY